MAFFHKASRSLLVTDAVVFVPEDPPEVISNKVREFLDSRRIAGCACFMSSPSTLQPH